MNSLIFIECCLILFSGVIYNYIGNTTYLLVALIIYLMFKGQKLQQDSNLKDKIIKKYRTVKI